MKGVAAGGELVEDEAEGEDVGLNSGLPGDELLGRHVGDGAAAGGVGAAFGGGAIGLLGSGGVEVGLVGAEAAGEAEVEDLDEAAVGEHDVGGLEVAMEDAERVRGGEAVGDLDAGGEDELEAGGALGDELVEALAGDVLHDDVGFGLVSGFGGGFADLVDGADVGVIDGGGEAGLAELGGAHLLGGEGAALEQLEHDGALQERVVGEVDDAAAAGADLAHELVLLDDAALHEGIISRAATAYGERDDTKWCNGLGHPRTSEGREGAFALPRPGSDGVVLPALAAADEEHREAEEEHERAPDEIEIDAEGAGVDVAAAGEDAVDGHEAADDEEDEAERDADVETHGLLLRSGMR